MNYNYNLEIITPTHIGDGSSYSNKEYFLKKDDLKLKKGKKIFNKKVNYINKLNLQKYLKNISSKEQNDFLDKIAQFTNDNKTKKEFNFERNFLNYINSLLCLFF